jgi:hypothetical protein
MLDVHHRTLKSYGFAVGSILVATLLRLWLHPILGEQAPYATYFLAVMVSAWVGGLGPALLAVGLGALGAAAFFIPPDDSLRLPIRHLCDALGVERTAQMRRIERDPVLNAELRDAPVTLPDGRSFESIGIVGIWPMPSLTTARVDQQLAGGAALVLMLWLDRLQRCPRTTIIRGRTPRNDAARHHREEADP